MPGAGMDGINCIGLFILDEAGRVKPFLNCGGKDLWAVSKVKEFPTHTLSSEVYPAGKLQ